MAQAPKTPQGCAGSRAAGCSAKILYYPSHPGWWWGWYKSASRWYLIDISPDDLDEENVPLNYEWWTECVPPLPPNAEVSHGDSAKKS
jgi:hypothetical protein